MVCEKCEFYRGFLLLYLDVRCGSLVVVSLGVFGIRIEDFAYLFSIFCVSGSPAVQPTWTMQL